MFDLYETMQREFVVSSFIDYGSAFIIAGLLTIVFLRCAKRAVKAFEASAKGSDDRVGYGVLTGVSLAAAAISAIVTTVQVPTLLKLLFVDNFLFLDYVLSRI